MEHAFPFDELKPIECIGRGRDREDPSNYGINDVMGDYLLTLVDSLDTLAVLGDREGFADAIAKTLQYLPEFDIDSHVQVFEVTIRMLGGLISAHIIATDEADVLGMRLDTNGTYNGELLHLARDLAYRLLPAFEASPTGVPYARTNLKHGFCKEETSSTCAAGVGTLLLEFGTLSRLTNETIFEDVARLAMAEMWAARSKTNLFGNVYDLQQQIWTQPIAGISAGVDSIYEYMFKSYVYFGNQEYLHMFEAAYSALLQYSRDTTGGYAFYNVHMRTGEITSSWVDALSAFFPGLMVLAGDVDGAESAYMLYYHIWNRFRAMPERFNLFAREPDISYYLLRPEFVETTYYMYQATRDPFYLDVGEMILTDLNELMRTKCGFTAMHDVSTHMLEERMDSFLLSETFKYLYLLFDENNPLHKLDNNFVFTTEGHLLLPLSPVRDKSAQYPHGASFSKRKAVNSPPARVKRALHSIDSIRKRLQETEWSRLFAFPEFAEPRNSQKSTSSWDRMRKCPMPRSYGLIVRHPPYDSPAHNGTQLPVDIVAKWQPGHLQSPLEQLHSMQQLNRALQSDAGHSLAHRPYLLSLHASSASAIVPLRNDFYNVGALVYQKQNKEVDPVRNGSAVAESALRLALAFDGMCSVSSHLSLSQRHRVWKSALKSDIDTEGSVDLSGDADTWLAPNTRQISLTDYILSQATGSRVVAVDASFYPRSRRGVPLFADLQMEIPDKERLTPAEFYLQQRQQFEKPERAMYSRARQPFAGGMARRRGYFPLAQAKEQQSKRRFVFTNGAGQMMSDYVIVRMGLDAMPGKAGGVPDVQHGSMGGGGNAGRGNNMQANNGSAAPDNEASKTHAFKTARHSKESYPRRRQPYDLHHRVRREYAGRLAYFAESALYRSNEGLLVPRVTQLSMLHLGGSSAIYGCEEYTPREQRLFAGKVVAVRAGGGCTTWEKAVHAMNAGASGLLVDEAIGESRGHSQHAEQSSAATRVPSELKMGGSAALRLTDRLQHICAWRTGADDKCWAEDQYSSATLYPEQRLWRWRQLQNFESIGNSAAHLAEESPYPITMPVVIVDQSVIDEVEEQLAVGRTIAVQLL
ncbi:hypothetical protein EV183_001095 [Coemansia sp. RSA 2336]|nr:hypothetical protein EV183_001095 [Coemansia sp. RSA 2336]